MPRYLHQFGYSTESIKGMITTPQDRREAAEKLFSAAGGKVIDMYFCFGKFDGIAISEFPSQVDAATVALTVGASGAFSSPDSTMASSLSCTRGVPHTPHTKRSSSSGSTRVVPLQLGQRCASDRGLSGS